MSGPLPLKLAEASVSVGCADEVHAALAEPSMGDADDSLTITHGCAGVTHSARNGVETMNSRGWNWLLVVAFLVAGCSGATTSTVQSSPTLAAATPVASSTPDAAALASAYLSLAAVGNKKLDDCWVGMQSTDIATVKVALADCTDANSGFMDGLAAVNWGALQSKVDALTAALAKEKAILANMERATSIAGVNTYNAQFYVADSEVGDAAAVLRVALGLPQASQNPTASPTPAGPKTYQVGDTVTVTENGSEWAKITISDVKVVGSYKGKYSNDTPKIAGNVFIQAKVAYEALVDGVDYNPFDWQVFCAGEAVQNYSFVLYGPQPGLSSGTLPSGRKASGYVVYEVPAKGEVRMSYKGNAFSNSGPVFEVMIGAA